MIIMKAENYDKATRNIRMLHESSLVECSPVLRGILERIEQAIEADGRQ